MRIPSFFATFLVLSSAWAQPTTAPLATASNVGAAPEAPDLRIAAAARLELHYRIVGASVRRSASTVLWSQLALGAALMAGGIWLQVRDGEFFSVGLAPSALGVTSLLTASLVQLLRGSDRQDPWSRGRAQGRSEVEIAADIERSWAEIAAAETRWRRRLGWPMVIAAGGLIATLLVTAALVERPGAGPLAPELMMLNIGLFVAGSYGVLTGVEWLTSPGPIARSWELYRHTQHPLLAPELQPRQ